MRALERLGELVLLLAGEGGGAWRIARRLGFAALVLGVAWMWGRACRFW